MKPNVFEMPGWETFFLNYFYCSPKENSAFKPSSMREYLESPHNHFIKATAKSPFLKSLYTFEMKFSGNKLILSHLNRTLF